MGDTSFLKLIPRELVNIIFSYLDITELNQFIKDNNELFDLINTKTFWVNYTIINGLIDYVPYFNLMKVDVDKDFYKAYKNILIIDDFLTKFMKYKEFVTMFELLVGTQTEHLFESDFTLNWKRLCNPRDLSFFQNYIKLNSILDMINNHGIYPNDQMFIKIFNHIGGIFFVGINEYSVSLYDLRLIFIKSMILGIDIWDPIISDLKYVVNYAESLYQYQNL
jgi:hypothetical protein